MEEQQDWFDNDLSAILRLMRSAMAEAGIPTAKIRETFTVFKRQVVYGQPLRLETDHMSPN